MKKKVSIFLLAVIFILTTLIIPTNQNSNQVHAAGTMKVGDYVLFGKYLGKPILWRVINIENGSPLLFSEKIISIKAYDAAESGKYYRTGSNPYTTDEARQKYGSNQWENSNIREWLNSSDAKVKYTTQPPTKAAVSQNAYDAEPGFLSNFTEAERNAIKPVTHKAILADIDKGKKTGGSEKHIYNENMITSLENYDVSYYKNVTDKVYLLDIKELYDYVYKRGYEYIKKPTKEAVEQSEYKYKILDPNNYWYYWLRLPCALQSSYVRHVDSDNFVYSSNANYYSGGIAPALNLKSASYISGKGTIDDPYIPTASKDSIKPGDYVKYVPSTPAKPNTASNTPANRAATMQVGDYVQFGSYLGKPILWRVINLDSNGLPMLFSERILALKSYDASESGWNGHTRKGSTSPSTPQEFREAYGSNNWITSNIREWLNSSDKKVKYSTQAPNSKAVHTNPYADEPGFLSNFTQAELNLILPVTHKTILSDLDKHMRDGGTVKDHVYNENIGDWVQNYDDVYYKNVTDKVYLLDIKELYEYVYKRDFDYVKKPTQQAVDNSKFKQSDLNTNNYWYYWLRVACTDDAIGVRHQDSDGFIYSSNASYYSGGIVPALNLKSGTYKSGKGTIDDPYIPDEGKIDNALYAKAYAAVQNAKSTKTQKSINAARAAIEALKGTSAHWAIGIFSAQVDTVQQPILAKVNSAVTKAKNTMRQADIDAIRTAMDPDLPDKLKNNYLATLQELQESLVGKAIEAHNKAVQSGSYADKSVAQALFADLEKAVDPAVAAWAKNAKNQTGIMQQVVTIKDKNLEKAIRNALNKPTGDLYKSELQSMTSLNGTGMSITDLSSLKYLTNLTDLRLDNNKISDISILKELKNLKYLSLSNNNISDITPLQGLTNLNKLFLNFNKITDISAVKNLTNLTWFYVEGNQIKNISVLHGLTKLTNLNLYNNEIRNLDIIALKKALPKCSFYNQ
ncbi:DUF6273 domain-containing protein [Clostridium prolinivorans]|uniref:DUF6273 domain-containing protein n=1 Tax=Clostridium prolinivorans TaxID=2769420 RepID=UPI000FDC471B|nr:DUF6273 domain-containing protein [Clostridium prolinivorans]